MNILNKLTIKHLKMNKKRTIVTIIGIILSTALMVGIGTIASSFRELILKEVIKNSGAHHVEIKDYSYLDYKYIKNNAKIKNATLEYGLGYSRLEKGENEYKPYLYIKEVNDYYLEKVVTLKEGRLPKNSNEILISSHIATNGKVNYHIGDKITLDIGSRHYQEEEEFLTQDDAYFGDEKLQIELTKEYTIVGIIERPFDEGYTAPGYTVITPIDEKDLDYNSKVVSKITYKKVKDAHLLTNELTQALGFSEEDGYKKINYNEGILAFNGASSYQNINNMIGGLVSIVLALVSIGCIIVIYNSFAISVMERKKQFGLFSSIGATSRQLKKTVFFEAFLVSIVGIPIGLISGILGIDIVLKITNHLLPNYFGFPLEISLYPILIIIPILFMMITIFVSAYLPARKAAKISPIEAIRLNDDIKMPKHGIKSRPIFAKILGIEAEIARKNMKRNKKKYRITILSLFISIVLFLSFSSILQLGMKGTTTFVEHKNYDIIVRFYNPSGDSGLINAMEEYKKIYESILKLDGIDNYTLSEIDTLFRVKTKDDIFSKAYFDYLKDEGLEYDNTYGLADMFFISLDDTSYQEYLKKANLSYQDFNTDEIKPIIINKMVNRDYEKQKVKEFKYIKNDVSKITLELFKLNHDTDLDKDISLAKFDAVVSDVEPEMLSISISTAKYAIISNQMLQKLRTYVDLDKGEVYYSNGLDIMIQAKEHDKVYKNIDDLLPEDLSRQDIFAYASDITANMQMQKNGILVIGMFLYGFIALVTLIGVTSVFNTINTSMALRRREFAILRSTGLTPKGFNKMLFYESILYGLKALIYGIPVAIGVMYLIYRNIYGVVEFEFMVPKREMIITIVSVFLLTFITMMYAANKIKKENILDAIREENI